MSVGTHSLANIAPKPNTCTPTKADGRVYFTAPGLFKASFGLTGSAASDVWYIIHLEFLTGVGPNRREEHGNILNVHSPIFLLH